MNFNDFFVDLLCVFLLNKERKIFIKSISLLFYSKLNTDMRIFIMPFF